MKIKEIRIGEYKCFSKDAGKFTDLGDVTCLIGKNGSGKTLLLKLLDESLGMNYSEDSHFFSEAIDRPIDIGIQLGKHDIETFENDYLVNPFVENNSTNVLFMREDVTDNPVRDSDTMQTFSARFAEIETLKQRLKEKFKLELADDTADEKYLELLENKGKDISKIFLLFNNTEQYPPSIDASKHIRCIYINEDKIIRPKYNLTELVASKHDIHKSLTFDQTLIDKVFSICDLELTQNDIKITSQKSMDQINSKLRWFFSGLLENSMDTEEYIEVNTYLRFGDSSEVDTKQHNYLKFGVTDKLRNLIDFDLASSGFQWLLSIYLIFEIEKKKNNDDKGSILLLLDEPGLHLHPTAQKSLVDAMYNLCENDDRFQIIYTTHSPTMISKEHIGDVKAIDRRKNEDGFYQSFLIDNPLEDDNQALLPLSQLMGIELGQCIQFGRKYVLVEGQTDYLYESKAFKILGDKHEWCIIPTHGKDKSDKYYNFFRANCFDCLVVLDYKNGDQLKNIRKTVEDDKHIILLSEILEKDADIEDMFGDENYIHMVEKSCGIKISEDSLNKEEPRIVKRIGEKNNTKFKKSIVAKHFHKHGFDNLPDPEVAKSNFKKLFELIDKRFKEYRSQSND